MRHPGDGQVKSPGGNASWLCTICHVSCDNEVKLRKHSSDRHSNDYPKVSCSVCCKTFASQRNYNRHIKMIHEGKYEYKHVCQLCGKGFLSSGDLEGHLNKHRGIKPYACYVCASSFTYQKDLRSHMKGHIEKARENLYL